MKPKAIIVSGYFNPLHKGHIEYFKEARKYADKLFIIVNNDYQRELKGSKKFMDESERVLIISELKICDNVVLSIDKDSSVINTLQKINSEFSSKFSLYFGNGGDQNNEIIPERDICDKLSIKLIDNLGEKIQSSSWILNNK